MSSSSKTLLLKGVGLLLLLLGVLIVDHHHHQNGKGRIRVAVEAAGAVPVPVPVPVNNYMGKRNSMLELNYVTKRKVPNGPDPIHNRRAGKSHRPPGHAR